MPYKNIYSLIFNLFILRSSTPYSQRHVALTRICDINFFLYSWYSSNNLRYYLLIKIFNNIAALYTNKQIVFPRSSHNS